MHDPVRCDPKTEGRDMELIGLDWRRCALENERRLDLSGCNYMDYAAGLAAGRPVQTDDPFCVALRKKVKK